MNSIIGNNKSIVYDPNDITRITRKEQTINNVVSCANNLSNNMYNIIWGE